MDQFQISKQVAEQWRAESDETRRMYIQQTMQAQATGRYPTPHPNPNSRYHHHPSRPSPPSGQWLEGQGQGQGFPPSQPLASASRRYHDQTPSASPSPNSDPESESESAVLDPYTLFDKISSYPPGFAPPNGEGLPTPPPAPPHDATVAMGRYPEFHYNHQNQYQQQQQQRHPAYAGAQSPHYPSVGSHCPSQRFPLPKVERLVIVIDAYTLWHAAQQPLGGSMMHHGSGSGGHSRSRSGSGCPSPSRCMEM
ncbi:hypothetical protein CC1G_07924 [Coprinopsis cinerea okayama7|uniref:Uncharacterized protein n=1 Tax=Coprinopsis cinerea (strain Okayama-7 / 130 / ATCC MYA-4618 / FGSC 9003) TaxID=240176 RepID=A8P6R3_COPC7|nr:hypothetical protein CC1G_07924 [Coprinopsis cinerea okayama7\|eukprot:XP_001839209.2 hypothetical protein CC1G_07924 [Coprinopsis cinerea okayama7\